jgi:plastocyanin
MLDKQRIECEDGGFPLREIILKGLTMIYRYTLLFCAFVFLTSGAYSTTYTVTSSGFTFSPDNITVNVGDTVVFSIGSNHTVLEVSQATWNANGNTPLSGGFSLPAGGGTLVLTSVGTHYYVCGIHYSMGMKGTINVVSLSLSTGVISPASYCQNSGITVPYTASGVYDAGNSFTAQLSDNAGSFSNAINIGSIGATVSGSISATIPNLTPSSGYKVRVISSNPSLTGTTSSTILTILERPLASITPEGSVSICQGNGALLTANSGSGLSYVWKRDGSTINGASGSTYNATLAGTYAVTVSNGSCSSNSNSVTIIVMPNNPTKLTWTGAVSANWSDIGNWDNPCAIPTSGDSVIIPAGTPPVSIPAITLASFTMNNASGITLTNDLQLSGPLTLTSGNIVLGNHNLIIQATGRIVGGGPSSAIIATGAGELRQANIGSGGKASAILFPVGSIFGGYIPVTITNAGTLDEFRVRLIDSVYLSGTSGAQLMFNSVGETWFISEGTPGGSNATLTFQWNNVNELPNFNRARSFVAHYGSSSWTALQAPDAATGSNPYQRSVTGVTAFSPFAVGDESSPLPVELMNFSAAANGKNVVLTWETATETNFYGFGIERSINTPDAWSSIGFVAGMKHDAGINTYRYSDAKTSTGDLYYRLRQIDLDGKYSYSPVVHATVSPSVGALAIQSLYPNPLIASHSTTNFVSFTSGISGHMRLALFNALGQEVALVFDGFLERGQSSTQTLNISTLPAGVYFYRLEQGSESVHKMLTILP